MHSSGLKYQEATYSLYHIRCRCAQFTAEILVFGFGELPRPCSRLFSCSVVSDSLWLYGLLPSRLLCLWDYPSKSTGVGCHFLLQGIFLNPGIEPVAPALAGGFFATEPPGKPPLWMLGLKSDLKDFGDRRWNSGLCSVQLAWSLLLKG